MRDSKPTPSSVPVAPQNVLATAKKIKQVVFIFDATAMMAPFSQIINSTYLAPLFRSFSNDSKQSPWTHEYAIVLFRDLPPHSDYLVQCSSFTKDLKQFVTWCTSVKFGTGGYSSNAVCEGLCAAFRLALAKKADERVFILFTNSSPNILPCKCCDNGDCMSHAKRIAAERIMLSIIAPRQIDALKEIFINSKPNSEPEEPHTMGDKSHLTLLRGLVLPASTNSHSIATPAPPHPGNPTTPMPTSQGPKPFWQGHLAWSSVQPGRTAPMLPIMAHAPAGADLSLYTAHEWPQVLHVSGVCSLLEPGIANHSATAPYADFSQSPQSKQLTTQEQASFASFIKQLQMNNWGAAVELPNRTMLIKPNTTNKGSLRAMIIPKLALKTQRQSSQPTSQQSQPNPPPQIPHSGSNSFSSTPAPNNPGVAPNPQASFVPQTMSNVPTPPTNPVSTPPTPPLSTSNQYIATSRSGQSVPISNVAQTSIFSPTTAVNPRTSLGTVPINAARPVNTEGQMDNSLETPLHGQNQQPQLQQIQQQLHQHLQQAHLQYQPMQQTMQQPIQQPMQLQQQQPVPMQQMQPGPGAGFQPLEQSPAPDPGDEDDVVLLEVQPSKKLKPSPQGQRAR